MIVCSVGVKGRAVKTRGSLCYSLRIVGRCWGSMSSSMSCWAEEGRVFFFSWLNSPLLSSSLLNPPNSLPVCEWGRDGWMEGGISQQGVRVNIYLHTAAWRLSLSCLNVCLFLHFSYFHSLNIYIWYFVIRSKPKHAQLNICKDGMILHLQKSLSASWLILRVCAFPPSVLLHYSTLTVLIFEFLRLVPSHSTSSEVLWTLWWPKYWVKNKLIFFYMK